MQKHKSFPFIILSIMLITVQACNMPAATATQAPVNNDPLIAAQQTVDSINLTQTASVPIVTATPSLTPLPTATFTPEFTSTPAFTSTPTFPYVTLSVGTNCRTGPDKIFPLIDTFLPGQTIEVLGRSPGGEYWYVRSPVNKTTLCWMWGFYATGGNLNSVAVFTPPPSPTATPAPDFDFSYTGLEACGAVWWVEFSVKNTGGIPLKSIAFSGRDTVTDNLLSSADDIFTNNDCASSSSIPTLDIGASYTVSAPVFTADPTGHKVKVNIKICTGDGITGQCVEKSIAITP